jgi:hypothetical protein
MPIKEMVRIKRGRNFLLISFAPMPLTIQTIKEEKREWVSKRFPAFRFSANIPIK